MESEIRHQGLGDGEFQYKKSGILCVKGTVHKIMNLRKAKRELELINIMRNII